ncbi:MAG: Fur family transcriptional regulator [Oscillospiraceae bacterium]|nr:Fur family transcriptional regulator [Oscillospiraceae bacterium]
MKEYATKQRMLLLSVFQEHSGEPLSIDGILAQLPPGSQISRSAVYRNVDKLAQEGILRKTLSEGGRKTLYHYIRCEAHCERLHLRCEKCGKVFHLENEADEDTLQSILQKNGFRLDEQATVLSGVCKDCNEWEEGRS